MAANLDRPVLVAPSGASDGSVIVGTGSYVVAHQTGPGTDEWDVITVEVSSTSGATVSARVPATVGGTAVIQRGLTANAGPVVLFDRWEFQNSATIEVNGDSTCQFKISVARYPAGANEPAAV